VKKDLEKSSRLFREHVAPLLAAHLQRGHIVLAEDTSDRRDFVVQLDQLAGIDAWQIIPGHAMRGIASRVQEAPWGSFDTFTIRWCRFNGIETERHKRLRALHEKNEGWLLPHLTCQTYVTPKLVRVGVVLTELLFLEVESHLVGKDVATLTSSKLPVCSRTTTNAMFLAVRWDWDRIRSGLTILEKSLDCRREEP
jgi:hypothetical protein